LEEAMGVQQLISTLRTLPSAMEIPRLIEAGHLRVKFVGERGGDGPLTWGQINTLRWSSDTGQYYRMIEWVFELPREATLDDIAAALSTVMARHESLRTTYPAGDSGPIQRVAQSGELAVEVYDIEGEPRQDSTVATELVRRLRAAEFDLSAQLPLRVAVARSGGTPRTVVVVYSHVAVDFASMAVVGAQFTALVGNPISAEGYPPAHQPLDQAAAERSEAGRRRAQAAARYWEGQLRRKPQCLYAVPPDDLDHGADEPLSGWLWSRAAALALSPVEARIGASRQMIVLAALCAVIAWRTRQDECVLLTRTSNRYQRRLREYVGSLAHDTPMSVETDARGFDELVRRAGSATLRAARNGLVDEADVLAVAAEVGHQRGVAYSRDCVFNDLTSAGPASSQQSPRGGSDADGSDAARALAQTTVRWAQLADVPHLLLFNLVQVEGELILGALTASTQRTPRSEIELILLGAERLLVAAAAGDIDLGRIGEITGIEPLDRGPGWVEVDSCWIELPEVQRLVEAALPASDARVFALPGEDGAAVLIAYLAGGGIASPAQAHSACMELLSGRYTAMAPGRYVICEQAPADLADQAAWLAQVVLAEGSGR
jgi:condensation domain-containing protein